MSSEATGHNNKFVIDTFLNLGDIELKRAERYRVFVTMIRFDLSVIDRLFPEDANAVLDQIVEFAQGKMDRQDQLGGLQEIAQKMHKPFQFDTAQLLN